MQTLSKEMARILESNTRTRNVDTAEVQEDLEGLRVVAAQVLAKEQLHAEDFDVNAVGVILMEKPTGDEVAKGTRSQNRANRFRKATKVAGLEEKVHFTVSRSEPAPDVMKKRLAMSEEQLKELTPPFNEAPWGWILVNFNDAGLTELSHWGETQEKVADLVAEMVEEYHSRPKTENGTEDGAEEPAAAGGNRKR